MSNLFDHNRLSQYMSALVDRKLKAITLSVTSSVGYLRQLVNESKTYSETTTQKAAEVATNTANVQQRYRDFLATYLGVNASDPTVSALNDPVKDKAFGIRNSDGRLRYAVRNGQGVLSWQDATVAADAQSVRDVATGLLLFLDISNSQRVKGPVEFDNITKVASVNDWTSTKPPRAGDVDARIKALLNSLIPPRTVVSFFGETAPVGWALCDGGTYSLADGSGTITTPDLRGKVIAGVSSDHALGATFGSTSKTVDTAMGGSAIALNYVIANNYAGGGTQSAVAGGRNGTPPSIDNPEHKHSVTIDVTQPTVSLNYIMKL